MAGLLEEAGLGDFVAERLKLPAQSPDLSEWRALVSQIKSPKPALRIAIVGKYVGLKDSYKSLTEALIHGVVTLYEKVKAEKFKDLVKE